MFWLKRISNEISIKNNTKELKATNENAIESIKNDFRINLRQSANLEIDNGNGYGIAKRHKLEDMI